MPAYLGSGESLLSDGRLPTSHCVLLIQRAEKKLPLSLHRGLGTWARDQEGVLGCLS